MLSIIFASLGSLLDAVASGLSLSSGTKYYALWIFCFVACLGIIAGTWGVQNYMKDSDVIEDQKQKKAEATIEIPIPPLTIIMNNSTFNNGGIINNAGGVNAPNNSGIIATAPVYGNITQVKNYGPKPRKISEAQKDIFIETMRPIGKTAKVTMIVQIDNPEAVQLAEQLLSIFKSAGIKANYSQGLCFPDPETLAGGVQIGVRNAHDCPPLFNAVANLLLNSGVAALGAQNPQWPESDKDKVFIGIYPQPSSADDGN